ncbi:MAG: ATPase domain-containing protein [Candidatus Thorarchaeota archaeon]
MGTIKTGIPGLDELLGGGLVEGSTTLLSGRSGSGKSVFGLQYLYEGAAQYDTPGIILTLENRPNDIRADAEKFGWDLRKLENDGKIIIIDAASSKAGLPTSERYALRRGFDMATLAETIYNVVDETNASRFVMDSLPGLTLRFGEPSEVRQELFRISALLNELKVTSVFISEITDSQLQSRLGVEQFVVQGLITLNLSEDDSGLDRTLLVWKMRRTQHSMKKHSFSIGSKGITVSKFR